MKFEVGDIVRLLHSGEEGVVVELMEKDIVRVEVNGMDFPVFADQLEHPYFQRFSKMRKTAKKKKMITGENLPIENKKKVLRKESGLSLAVLPVYDQTEEAIVSSLKMYLVNETKYTYQVYCKEYLRDELDFEVKSEIASFNQYYLKDLPFEFLNDRPHLEFIFTPLEPTEEMVSSYPYKLKLKSKQIIKKLSELNRNREAMFSYLLFKKYPLKELKEKEHWDLPAVQPTIAYYKRNVSVQKEFRDEVDLHIEKLTEDYQHLSASDILLMQLAELHHALEQAIANRQYSLVVIHGIGKGVLKREVHEILKQTPEVKRFINQHDFRYGFGATEIFFEYL